MERPPDADASGGRFRQADGRTGGSPAPPAPVGAPQLQTLAPGAATASQSGGQRDGWPTKSV